MEKPWYLNLSQILYTHLLFKNVKNWLATQIACVIIVIFANDSTKESRYIYIPRVIKTNDGADKRY